jgi:NTP pyrophosphatase (non-canonical NTP hydrolase)
MLDDTPNYNPNETPDTRQAMKQPAESISLEDAQSMVDSWIKTVGVRYFSELTNTAVLMEEVGELARLMSRSYGDQSFKSGEKQGPEALADEMSDVLFVLICLANQTGVDLTQAFHRGMEKRTIRDADRHKSNPKLG